MAPESKPNLLEALTRASALLKEDQESDVVEILTGIYIIHDYENQGDRPVGTYDCGSVKLEDTPVSLYRALFLFHPERVCFRRMYKESIFTLVSPDYSLVATVEFFKYELGVYFSAAKEHIETDADGRVRGSSIISGSPGSDNGIRFKGELASLWFGFLVELLQREWRVYSGNNFTV